MSKVVVVSHRMTEAMRAAVVAACDRAHVPWSLWSEGDAISAGSSSLVVAGLRAGERKIHSDVIRLVDAGGDDAHLLLLSPEPLVRPVVTLQEGKVVVTSAMPEADQMYSLVRMLAGNVEGEESLAPTAWSGEISQSVHVKSKIAGMTLAVIPIWDARSASDVETVEIPLSTSEECAPIAGRASELLDKVTAVLAGAGPEGAKGATVGVAISEAVRDEAGVVGLSPDGRTWMFYWPRPAGTLRLFSKQRLPQLFDVAGAIRSSDNSLLRIGAQNGDLVLAASEPLHIDDEELVKRMSGGGPRLLDFLREREGVGSTLVGLITEVR